MNSQFSENELFLFKLIFIFCNIYCGYLKSVMYFLCIFTHYFTIMASQFSKITDNALKLLPIFSKQKQLNPPIWT